MRLALNPVAPDRARVETLELKPNGRVPNSALPVVLIRGALDGPVDDGQVHELYRSNGWQGCWTWTVYDFHHYHSTAHEALAVATGQAVLMLGGDGGREVTLRPGDLVVLPAGTGHRRLLASDDFAVCGAYPPGQEADLLRPEEADPEEARERIAAVPLPRTDPFCGAHGPLTRLWPASDTSLMDGRDTPQPRALTGSARCSAEVPARGRDCAHLPQAVRSAAIATVPNLLSLAGCVSPPAGR